MPMPARKRRGSRPASALLLTVALVLAGCGDSDTDDPQPAQPGSDRSSVSEQSTALQDGAMSTSPIGPCGPAPAPPSPVPPVEAPTGAEPSGLVDVTIETNCGPIGLELDAGAAPETVRSFLHLAETDYWVDSPCHRLTTAGIWVLQCGDPTGTGRGGPGYTFGIENAPADGEYPRGTLAMARAQSPDSNGGQFFLVYDDTQLPTQSGGYTTFGRVTEGMDIIDTVAREGVGNGGTDGPPSLPISILGVSVDARGT